MKRLLGVMLGVLTAIGGFMDIGDIVANSSIGAKTVHLRESAALTQLSARP